MRRTRRQARLDFSPLRTRPASREPFFRATVHRRRRWPTVLGFLALVGLAAGGWFLWDTWWSEQGRSRVQLDRTVAGYLRAWERGDWEGMRRLVVTPPKDFFDVHRRMFSALEVTAADLEAGEVTETGPTARVPIRAALELEGLGPWSYRGELTLHRTGDRWRVRWTPATLHPHFRRNLSFARTRTWPDRAPILARDGGALTVEGDVVTVGLVPGRIESRERVKRALERHAGVPPARVDAALDARGVRPDWFVPIVTLRTNRYLQVRPELYPVPGVFFRRGRGRILLEEGLAQHVVGRVDDATVEQLEEFGEPYVRGDRIGQYGLERAFEERLAGTPSGTVELVDDGGGTVRLLHRFEGREPEPVKSYLDVGVQRAAERALDGVDAPAALVAIDAETGQIRGVANAPAAGSNRAMAGHYPPGSTFKVVTAAALLADGRRLDGPVQCPPEVLVEGKRFRNFEGEALGEITFREAFAHSCNTAFIRLALGVTGDALAEMAQTFGFRSPYRLPLALASTQFPEPEGQVELAASAIGQGRVLATPLHMASVAAAAADGAWRAPRLTTTDRKLSARPLPKGVAKDLRELMRGVVAGGTGVEAAVPGMEVAGKTGTAEYGSSGRTHAWFIGFRGKLAFANVEEGGGVGGEVAAPIAARFLRAL